MVLVEASVGGLAVVVVALLSAWWLAVEGVVVMVFVVVQLVVVVAGLTVALSGASVMLSVLLFTKNSAVVLPWFSSKLSRAHVFLCLSVRPGGFSSPFLLRFLFRRFRFALARCSFVLSFGLKSVVCASLASCFSAFVIRFGAGVAGAGRNLSLVVSPSSFHCISTLVVLAAVPCFSSQICFHSARFFAIFTSCWNELVGGESLSRLDISLFSYWTLTACFTRRSSPIRRMCPSHSNLRFLIARSTLKVLLRGLASACAVFPVILDINLALAPFIAAEASLVRRQASLPYVSTDMMAALKIAIFVAVLMPLASKQCLS